MLTRIVSGVIGGAALIAVLLLPPYVLAVVAVAASIIGLFEFSNAMKKKGIHIDLIISCIAAVAIIGKAYGATLSKEVFPVLSDVFANVFHLQYLNALLYIIIVYFFCRIIFEKGRFRLEDMAYTLLGILYIPFLLAFIVSTRNLQRGFEYVWLIFIGAMMTDIFAYFSGVFLGKTKIIPHISPKKTIEGSIGGALGCMLIMILYGALVVNRPGAESVSLVHFAVLGLLCGIVSQLGDWAASAIKRDTGIKDYGKLIPGHGGIMDRADSILFVAPLIFIYVSLFMC